MWLEEGGKSVFHIHVVVFNMKLIIVLTIAALLCLAHVECVEKRRVSLGKFHLS